VFITDIQRFQDLFQVKNCHNTGVWTHQMTSVSKILFYCI